MLATAHLCIADVVVEHGPAHVEVGIEGVGCENAEGVKAGGHGDGQGWLPFSRSWRDPYRAGPRSPQISDLLNYARGHSHRSPASTLLITCSKSANLRPKCLLNYSRYQHGVHIPAHCQCSSKLSCRSPTAHVVFPHLSHLTCQHSSASAPLSVKVIVYLIGLLDHPHHRGHQTHRKYRGVKEKDGL